jgi:hypothetical protein
VNDTGTPVTPCNDGYWLSTSQAGFKQTHATLLAAMSRGERSASTATNERWSGSSGSYCKLSTVRVIW